MSIESSNRPPRRWFSDPLWPFFLALGVGIFFYTVRRYPAPPAPPRFPRQSAEFRSKEVLEAAQASAQAAIAQNPDNVSAYLDMVLACFESGGDRYVKGLESLERARDLGALDERLFYYAGVMYDAQGLFDYAVPEYEKFLRRHPDDLETLLRLANLYYRLEELDKSIEAYRRVLAAKPNDPLVSYNLALAYRDKKNWSAGVSSLKPFLEAGQPLPLGGHKLLGDLYLGSGDPGRAMLEYDRERAGSGESVDLVCGMARAAEGLGQTDKAIECWRKVVGLDPANREARSHLRKLKQPIPGRRK